MKHTLTRQEVYELIDGERIYQESRWNKDTTTSEGNHSNAEWLVYIRDYVEEALHICSREADPVANQKAAAILRKVAALAVSAMENNGAPKR